MNDKRYIKIVEHYEDCLEKHGDSYLGVDWPKLEDASLRYKIMLDIIKETDTNTTLLDFGCGLSHLYDFIKKNNYSKIEYNGLDLSEKFIQISKSKYPENKYYFTDILSDNLIKKFDYIIANGVFTEKRDLDFDEMFDYFKKMLLKLFFLCNNGIAFNVMSKQVDWERDDLFHLPLDLLADFLTKNLSRNFIIRNDYGLYEYTVYVYK